MGVMTVETYQNGVSNNNSDYFRLNLNYGYAICDVSQRERQSTDNMITCYLLYCYGRPAMFL